MNIFSQIFGIFRQQGLVRAIKENRSLTGFTISAILVSILGGALYGFAMGIGLGMDTSFKDAIKVSLIITLGLLFSIPVFWLAYRLLGREERPAQVAAVPLTFVATVATTLGPTVDLIKEKAVARAKAIDVKEALVKGAFELLMSGNKEEHDQQIYAAARELARDVEVIVFAQGSMTRLASRAQKETGLPVLTSPRLGIEYVKQLLDSMDRQG